MDWYEEHMRTFEITPMPESYKAVRGQPHGPVRAARARPFERQEGSRAGRVLFEAVDAASRLFHVFDEKLELTAAEISLERGGEVCRRREDVDDGARVRVEPL